MAEASAEILEKINRYTRRPLTAEEVYLFDVKLCDNEVDRDGERFSIEALRQLQALFVGKTGIFDHNPTGENQTARLYDTALVEEPDRQTAAGESYVWLRGSAYTLATPKNADLIAEIDGGIKKEVSIACFARRRTCSICGKDRTEGCTHVPGQWYGNALCHTILSEIEDAYEWSFVAIPAQREAGVTKRYASTTPLEKQVSVLEAQLEAQEKTLQQAEDALRKEVIRLQTVTGSPVQWDVQSMDLAHLLEAEAALRQKQSGLCAQLLHPPGKATDNDAYCMRGGTAP